MVGEQLIEDIDENGLRFYDVQRPFIPVEFAVAAYRFGHSTIRSRYRVNEHFVADLFPLDPEAAEEPRTDLRGGPVRPEHAVDWRYFFQLDPEIKAARAKRLEAKLNRRSLDLPGRAVPGAVEGALPRSSARWWCATCCAARPSSCRRGRTWRARSARSR
ncbi:hypothetical protein OOZ19_11045 [Saccharopolyspora sp. NFXS83]|uniref:hypothetical protein n=1 Tax=Saccharopolyspora sp. NFXS83 TaxID=2993560 RepID=UPI00224B7D6E|nr:hypothetical protein [Saccharopolyspora sp. NFXS83]MCX2730779.1 hypothetical protein [Saccharopolyspora sp. NFXS83]